VYCTAAGINNLGHVAETCALANGLTHAFLFSGNVPNDLGTGDQMSSVAAGLNDKDQVTGTIASSTSSSYTAHAFLYSSGAMSDLGVPPGGTVSGASAINNSGQIVGNASFNSSGASYAFLYSAGSWSNLGVFQGAQSPPASSLALGVNNSGQVTGACGACTTPGNFNEYAFLYSNGVMANLGTLSGYQSSFATGINNKGEVVGWSGNGFGQYHAFLYSGGAMKDLGTLQGPSGSSGAYAINDAGTVVGWYSSSTSNVSQAFVYSFGRMTDLNALISPGFGITLTSAVGINDLGQIAATGYVGSNTSATHAYLLSPCGPFVVTLKAQSNGKSTAINQMFAEFSPASGVTMGDMATACGFTGFNFQQVVTNRPCPSPSVMVPVNRNVFPMDNYCMGATTGLTAPPAFPDPPPSGYAQYPTQSDGYPFYESPTIALTFNPYKLIVFEDAPTDVCLPTGNVIAQSIQSSQCGGNPSNGPTEFMGFKTALVGMIAGSSGNPPTPSPAICEWTWRSTWLGLYIAGVDIGGGGISNVTEPVGYCGK
jgi:probable HAF family extracellular repeat protein